MPLDILSQAVIVGATFSQFLALHDGLLLLLPLLHSDVPPQFHIHKSVTYPTVLEQCLVDGLHLSLSLKWSSGVEKWIIKLGLFGKRTNVFTV
jgi:hypothetical protein